MTTRNKSSFLIALSIALVCAGVPASGQAAPDAPLNLVLIGENAHVDPSTKALGRGHYKMVERHAVRALRQAPNELEALLAHHNLCVAMTLQGKTADAVSHCSAVINSSTDLALKPRRGKFLEVTDTTPATSTPGLYEAIHANLRSIGVSDEAANFAQRESAKAGQSSAL